MADFETARKITAHHEGGYANNPADTGGETMFGVSRNNFKDWPGWEIVDQIKAANPRTYVAVLNNHSQLKEQARAFYKAVFWDCYRADQIQNQAIANELFDTGVNMGQSRAATFLQRAINVTNNRGKRSPDVVVDGKVGPATIAALNAHTKPALVFKVLNGLQCAAYVSFAESKESQEQFMESWLSRVNF
jgi:lysozyme family protein